MRTLRCGLVFVLALLLFCISTSSAQTQPSGDDQMYRPGMQSDPYRGYGDYPAAEVNSVPIARAQAVRARLEQELIQTNLHRWIDNAWDEFSNSKDYLDSSSAERKALDDYNRERERVLAKVRADSGYRALAELVSDLTNRIERERPRNMKAASDVAVDNMMALATVKLGYTSQLSAMESAALQADGAVQSARSKLVDAGNKSRDMRKTFARSVRRNPDFLSWRGRVDEAKINTVVAATFLDSVIDARNIALNYAYYVHSWDRFKYLNGAYAYPYYAGYYGSGYMRRY